MSGMSVSYLTSMLAYSVPTLLVYAVAFVLAIIFMRRAALPSALTLAGIGVVVVSVIATTLLQTYLVEAQQSNLQSVESFGQMMMIVGIGGSCVRALGTALLVAAIFVGRRPKESRPANPGPSV